MKLPTLTGRELIVLLQKAGFKVVGQRGQHVSLRKGDRRLIIPYNETLAEQTLLNIIDQADLDAKDILNLLHQKGSLKQEEKEEEPTEEGEEEPIPIIAMGFGRESWYGMVWGLPVALIRVLTGILFLIFALQKAPWVDPPFGWFSSMVNNIIKYPNFAWYSNFYAQTVQSNLQLFGWISFLTELVVAISLIAGIYSVLGGALGGLHVTWFALGALGWPHEWEWSYIFWAAICFMLAATKAGRVLGADLRISQWLESRQEAWWARVLLYLT